jgi:hypothetical protein
MTIYSNPKPKSQKDFFQPLLKLHPKEICTFENSN